MVVWNIGTYVGQYAQQLTMDYALMGLNTDLLSLYLDAHFTLDAIVSIREVLADLADINGSTFELTMLHLINLDLPVRKASFIISLIFYMSEVSR
jgi:hypothetical protein